MTPRPRRSAEHVSCPHYPDCVSCPLVGTTYGEQLRRKRERLRETLSAAGLVVDVPEAVGSPRAFQYRTQAKLVLRRARRGLLIGVYRPGTHQVADVSRCAVHHPLVNRALDALRQEVEQSDLDVYDERTRRGLLRYAVVRVSAWRKRAQLILVTASPNVPDARGLARSLMRRMRAIESVVQNVNSDPGNVILGPTYVTWAGAPALRERVGALDLVSRPGSFLQANVPVARRVYECAASWAKGAADEIAVDLYCGVGGLTFHLAPAVRRVFGVEAAPPAVLDAKANVRINGFHNVRFRAGEAGPMLEKIRLEVGKIDVVTLNPPRGGAEEEAREAIARCVPDRIVYVSCEPTTLARDAVWFRERGYRLARVQPFDMLPQTEHVETVALMQRVRPAATGSSR